MLVAIESNLCKFYASQTLRSSVASIGHRLSISPGQSTSSHSDELEGSVLSLVYSRLALMAISSLAAKYTRPQRLKSAEEKWIKL
jgi:hypothetical protein